MPKARVLGLFVLTACMVSCASLPIEAAWKPPVLKSYQPTPKASSSPQSILVKGENFHAPIQLNVGTASNVGGNQFTWTVTLPTAGSVQLIATVCQTPTQCRMSNVLTVTVLPGTPIPPPPLGITCPSNKTVNTPTAPVAVTYDPATPDGGAPPVSIEYSAQPGASFPAGSTPVTATARDTAGQIKSCQFTVTVAVATPSPSPNCARIVDGGGGSIISADGATWTLDSQLVRRNGVQAGGGLAVVLERTTVDPRSDMQALGPEGAWWIWVPSINGWLLTGLPDPCAVPPPSTTVYTQSDFTYLGSYDVKVPGAPYNQGLAIRWVNGDLRFITLSLDHSDENGYVPYLHEWSLAGKNFGDLIQTVTNTWQKPWGDPIHYYNGRWFSLWWEEAKQRLWTTEAIDYTNTNEPTNIFVRTLNADGSISNLRGPIGLEGIGAKRTFGGVQAVPSYFQTQYGVGPYAIGWGGYTSLMAQGSIASLGLTFYTIPEPTTYANGAQIPASNFKVLADHSAASQQASDWWTGTGLTQPNAFDRGVRFSRNFVNYYDSGDPRQNPISFTITVDTNGTAVSDPNHLGRFQPWLAGYRNTQGDVAPAYQVKVNGVVYTVASVEDSNHLTLTASAGVQQGVLIDGPDTDPKIPPDSVAQWQNNIVSNIPPDGRARWSWSDSYFQTGTWIKGPNKEGFLTIASLIQGNGFYTYSHLTSDATEYEFQMYDPQTLARAAQGQLQPWQVQPDRGWLFPFEGMGQTVGTQGPRATAFDAITSRLFVLGAWVDGQGGIADRLYVFQVKP